MHATILLHHASFMSGWNRLDDGDRCFLTWHSKICFKDVLGLCSAHYLFCACSLTMLMHWRYMPECSQWRLQVGIELCLRFCRFVWRYDCVLAKHWPFIGALELCVLCFPGIRPPRLICEISLESLASETIITKRKSWFEACIWLLRVDSRSAAVSSSKIEVTALWRKGDVHFSLPVGSRSVPLIQKVGPFYSSDGCSPAH